MPPIFCIVSLGRKRGKTSLIEWLLRELSRGGIRVSTVKHSMEGMDVQDKDTWRHLRAGAVEVAYVSPGELVFLRKSSVSLEEVLGNFRIESDVILIEGFKSSPYPKILCADDLKEVEEAARTIENVIAATGKITSEAEKIPCSPIKVMNKNEILKMIECSIREDWVRKVPGLNCGKCEYGSCAALAKAIKDGEATIRDCQMRRMVSAKLIIDGVAAPLGKWPQRLLKELLKGFVRSLKLSDVNIEAVEKIVVEVNLKEPEKT